MSAFTPETPDWTSAHVATGHPVSASTYAHQGCRCPGCKAMHAAAKADLRRRRGASAHERARLMAVDWVRKNRPYVWEQLLEQAREDIKIAAVPPSPLRPGRRASTPQPAGASNTAEVALPQSSGADPLPPRSTRSTTPHRAASPGSSASRTAALPGADLPPGHAAVGRAARRPAAASGGAS